MTPVEPDTPACRRWAVTVRGVVQGVGFRPFVFQLARAERLAGWVVNEADAVRLELQGSTVAFERFLERLRQQAPPQSRIESVETREVPVLSPPESLAGFQIRHSSLASAPRPAIPADLASCPECLREICDPSERRHGYPFTNCTNCGPRWSIITALPYDRARTSMAEFSLCPACAAEYGDPADRRFHAQPMACPACGPKLTLLDADGARLADTGEALALAAHAVLAGEILALKGLGGFQLLVDAASERAVARLRQRKQRPHKPLAVMFPTLDSLRQACAVSPSEELALAGHQAPILLVRRRDFDGESGIAAGVAPGNPYLGAMLPYTPLHHLLLARLGRPVVCTSGNLAEEPMATTTADALERLGRIADRFLTHDRPIVRPVDDSVARSGPLGLQLLRRARGFAPLPIRLGFSAPTILAVGGHLKNTVALSLGEHVVCGPHIGDLDNAASVEVHRRAITDLVDFFAVTPEAVACDLHPDYASTRHAERLAAEWDVPLIRVQHHHAHVASCLAEHRLTGPSLGCSWDGTGYGLDGTVWGGEFLLCDGAGFSRTAHLRAFSLPGGDLAAREPRRAALGLLFEILGDEAASWAGRWFSPAELQPLLTALRRPKLFPRTTSLGRLFDAVAALCGLQERVSFEGQAAMALEFAADPAECSAYPLPLSQTQPAVADWEPLVREVLRDLQHAVPLGSIAARFHNALAELAVAVARWVDCRQVVLTGGCFQNAWLTWRVRERLLAEGCNVYIQREVPPGDGGLALGQLWVAAKRLS